MKLRSEKNGYFWSYRRNIVARCRRKYDRRSSLLAGQRNACWFWVAHTALTLTPALIVCCVSVPRDATHSADYTVARCSSVCPSVRPCAGIMAKLLNILSNCLTVGCHTNATIMGFSLPSGIAIVQQGPYLPGESNAKGVWKNCRSWHRSLSTYKAQRGETAPRELTSSDLVKYSMTRSIARSLCDSWASCPLLSF